MQERFDFTEACLPAYQTNFPEILDEIAGLAEGQNCDEQKL